MSQSSPSELPFNPTPRFSALEACFDQIPRYLYRTWAPKTNGSSTEKWVNSAAICNGNLACDFFEFDQNTAAKMLENHVLWRNMSDDNLMSWTSSLIYAVQLARYRLHRDWGNPRASQIFICVVDTRKFDRRTFLPARDLLRAFGVRNWGKTTHDYYHGELLSQGALDITGKSKTVSYAELIQNGLLDIYPDIPRDELWWAVKRHRDNWMNTSLVTEDDLRYSATIAKTCYGGEWTRPLLIALISLKPRSLEDELLLEGIRHELDEPISEAAIADVARWETLPVDLEQCIQITKILYDLQQEEDALTQDSIEQLQQLQHEIDALPPASSQETQATVDTLNETMDKLTINNTSTPEHDTSVLSIPSAFENSINKSEDNLPTARVTETTAAPAPAPQSAVQADNQASQVQVVNEKARSANVSPCGGWIVTTLETQLMVFQIKPPANPSGMQQQQQQAYLSLHETHLAELEQKTRSRILGPAGFQVEGSKTYIDMTVGSHVFRWDLEDIQNNVTDTYVRRRLSVQEEPQSPTPDAVVTPEPVATSELIVKSEPVVTSELVIKSEPAVKPEPVIKSEPVINSEPPTTKKNPALGRFVKTLAKKMSNHWRDR